MSAVVIDDFGPANNSMFPLMSGLQVGDVMWIGSRNLMPARVIGYDLSSRRVVHDVVLGPGKFVQALATSPDGTLLYAGIVDAGEKNANLYVIDLTQQNPQARAAALMPGLDVRVLCVAEDGVVYAAGKEVEPALWEWDPRQLHPRRVCVPDPRTTQARGLAVSGGTVYFGSGSNLAGGEGASKSAVFAVDRATSDFISIQPHELDDDTAVRQLAIASGLLYIGTQGVGGNSHLAVLSLSDPGDYRVFEFDAKSVGVFHFAADTMYAAASRVFLHDPNTGSIERVPFDDTAERWAIGRWHDELVNVSSSGTVTHVNLVTGETVKVDLVEAGAPRLPQLGMSIAASSTCLYVGGNSSIVERRLDDLGGAARRLVIHGEAKSIETVGDDIYFAMYNSAGLWHHRPGNEPRRIAMLPIEQNRPQDTAWDPINRLLLIGSQNDTQGGGSLATWSVDEEHLRVHVNPFDERQMVRAVASLDGFAYIGGWNRYPIGADGEVACIDPVTALVHWRVDHTFGAGISCLAARGDRIYGLTMGGTFFVLDRANGALLATQDASTWVAGFSRMMVDRAQNVYAVSSETVLRVEDGDWLAPMVERLGAQWYSGPKITADADGRIYTLRGRDLVRIAVPEAA